MHPAAAAALFNADAAHITGALAARRGWVLHAVSFPLIDCSFRTLDRHELRLKLHCEDWNDKPPAIDLCAADGSLLTSIAPNPTGVFNTSAHPIAGRPFICMRGSREYHTHTSHVSDPWDNLRGTTNYSLGNILSQIWSAWLQGND